MVTDLTATERFIETGNPPNYRPMGDSRKMRQLSTCREPERPQADGRLSESSGMGDGTM